MKNNDSDSPQGQTGVQANKRTRSRQMDARDVEKWLATRQSKIDNSGLSYDGRNKNGMEQCQYCEMSYHPMPRYVKGNSLIYVCHFRLENGQMVEHEDCKNKAIADGYVYRSDLTPRR